MSSTYTASKSETFTITDAKYLASKVQTDLMRLHRLYYASHSAPTINEIQEYHDELVLLQIYNFLKEIEYGFRLDQRWIKALKYTARQSGVLTTDDDPGGIRHTIIPNNARFTSFLRYNNRWNSAECESEQKEFLNKTPVKRTTGKGYAGTWMEDRAYSSSGRGLMRSGV